MRFADTPIKGAFVLEIEPRRDERGHFARTFDRAEFRRRGLASSFAECSVSFNERRGTLRGLHYQVNPHPEAKLVRCTRGRIHDVIVDLRPRSPTRGRWHAVELGAENGRLLYIPEGVAHGFLTLEPRSEVYYEISAPYAPACARGIRWDDPAFAIRWPAPPEVISERDRSYPDYAGRGVR